MTVRILPNKQSQIPPQAEQSTFEKSYNFFLDNKNYLAAASIAYLVAFSGFTRMKSNI